MKKRGSKITIVGTGLVGSTTAYALMLSGIASEIVMIDVDARRAEGEAMDLSHAASFVKPVLIRDGTFEDAENSNIIVFTAGARRKEGQTRLELQSENVEVIRRTLPKVLYYAGADTVLIMVSNPVDILTYVAWKISGFPVWKILGSGTVLDSSRFRYTLAKEYLIDARNIHAHIIGEHGDTSVPVWSLANISGLTLEQFHRLNGKDDFEEKKARVFEAVRTAGAETIKRKGSTYYAIAAAVKRICESVLRDEHSVLTVGSVIDGMYDIKDVALSLPAIITANGRKAFLEVPLSEGEMKMLHHSADTLKANLKELGLI